MLQNRQTFRGLLTSTKPRVQPNNKTATEPKIKIRKKLLQPVFTIAIITTILAKDIQQTIVQYLNIGGRGGN